MTKSDSESKTSSSSDSATSSSAEDSSADEGRHDGKNVIEKKKTEKDSIKIKKSESSDRVVEDMDKNSKNLNKERKLDALKVKKSRKKKHESSSESSSSSSSESSASSDSRSDGEVSSSDSSSDSEKETKQTMKENVKKDLPRESDKEEVMDSPRVSDKERVVDSPRENDKEKVVEETAENTAIDPKPTGEETKLLEDVTTIIPKDVQNDNGKDDEMINEKKDDSEQACQGPNETVEDAEKIQDISVNRKSSQDALEVVNNEKEATIASKSPKDCQEEGELPEEDVSHQSDKEKSPTIDSTDNNGPRKLQSMVIKTYEDRSRSRSKSNSPQNSRENSKERSKSPRKNDKTSDRSRSRTPTQRKRRSRTRSYTTSRSRSRSRSRSYSRERRSDKRKERRRSPSADHDKRRVRRSESVERRREERKKRHAERDEQEEIKRSRREEENAQRRENEVNKPGGDPDKVKELDNTTVTDPKAKITQRQRKTVDLLTSRTGGAYIPPAKLRLMQAQITDKSSAAYQRIAWEALKKSIHGYINKVNVDNIAIITRELLKENIVRGRGLLCRSIIQAQSASPTFTHVYAALVSIINSKFPNIGELLLKRLVIQFKRAFRRNDKAVCLSSSRFIAHLVNQRVAHEILALEILTLLVESPTDDSVEVAIAFLKECGMKLTEVSSKGIGAIFEMLKNILHEGKLDKRVQYMIEVVFQVRKDGFKDHQSVIESLELVEEDDQFTHLLMLDDATNTEDMLNAFKFDEEYAVNEDKYKGLSKEILGSDASDSDGSSSDSGSGSDSDGSDSDEDNEKGEGKPTAEEIIDNTETNLIALRRTIYLTINSSLDYEECAHKLMKMQLKPGQEIELCHMFLDCCAEQRTYEKFYGLLAQRFCSINKIYIEPFEEIFKDTYQTTHRLDTNRLRNVSKFFAHLLFTDAIGWDVLECIKLNEEDTTSSSRIFIKILFQELAEYMGLSQLNKKLKDDVLLESLAGLFPKDNPRNTRFSINFFTSIGLGGLTDELRQFLKNAPKSVPAINAEILANKPINVETSASSSSTTSSSTSSSDSSSSNSSSSSDSSSDSDSESEVDKKKRKGKKQKKTKKSSSKKKKQKSKKTKTKSKKNKKKPTKSKKSKKQKSSDENSSSESVSESENNSSSSSSESSSEDEKRKSKKKAKSKKNSKTNKKSKKNNRKSVSEDEELEDMIKSIEHKNKQSENGDKRPAEFSDRRREKHDFCLDDERLKRPEPQRRDSELERRREEREKRHREKAQTRDRDYSERERKRTRSRSRDRREDRSQKDDRNRRDYERDRDSERRKDRKRYDDRKSRSRSRDRSNKRDYERSKTRNTSKERG